jgi:hypothetical protein
MNTAEAALAQSRSPLRDPNGKPEWLPAEGWVHVWRVCQAILVR